MTPLTSEVLAGQKDLVDDWLNTGLQESVHHRIGVFAEKSESMATLEALGSHQRNGRRSSEHS